MKTSQQVASGFTATRMVKPQGEEKSSKKVLNVVLKCDTLGSLEALLGMFEKVQHDDVGVEVIQKGLGNINENDITRAENSPPAVVYAFGVMVSQQAASLARDKNVEVKEYKIIYELFDNIVEHLNILVPPEVIVTPLGEFEAVAIFRTEPNRMVVGGKVKDGKIVAGEKARVWRGEEPIGLGIIDTVQSGKSTVKEAHGGQECGISFKGKTRIMPGDRIEVFHEEVKERKIAIGR